MNLPHMNSLLIAVALVLLNGCAAYDSVKEMVRERDRKEEAARVESAKLACEKYGFRVGTDSYAQCLQTEVNQIKNREAIALAAEEAGKAKSMTCRKDLMGEVTCTPNKL